MGEYIINSADLAEKRTGVVIPKSETHGLKEISKPTNQEIKKILFDPEACYGKMEVAPLTNKEKRECLKAEVLADLSMQEYIALWRRLNPYFLSHVTRHGFRDHIGMEGHTGGFAEFHDGFAEVLKDDKMVRPPFAIQGLRSRDESSIKTFLGDWVLKAQTKEEALDRLDEELHGTYASAPNFPDKTAVHLAAEVVAEDVYGGEKNNEIFFVFPSDFIASQHNFVINGGQKDLTKPQSNITWNDIFVWPSSVDDAGIQLDAGIVFLPENKSVDPNTGSKYVSEIKMVDGREKRVMIEDEKSMMAFMEWLNSLNEQSIVKIAYNEFIKEKDDLLQQNKQSDFVNALAQDLRKIGFGEDVAAELIEVISRVGLPTLLLLRQHSEFFRAIGLNWWRRPQNTISSKEYWEGYFVKNPYLKPKHLIYYNGDPTLAVLDFLQKNNIGQADVSEEEGKLLGFDDNHIEDMGEDPRARVGYNEFLEIANKIISEYYGGSTGQTIG